MQWRIVVQELDGSEGVSSAMTQDEAIAWARELAGLSVPVMRIETLGRSVVIDGEELAATLCSAKALR